MKKPSNNLLKLTAVAVLALAGSQSAKATDKTLTTAGDWNTAGNWTPSGIPTASDNATISAVNGTIAVGANGTAANVTVSPSTAANRSLTLSGAASSLTTGVLTLGGSVSGSTGYLIMNGASTLTATSLVMGPGVGNGDLQIAGSGTINLNGGAGSITHTGSGSAIVEVNGNAGALGLSSASVTHIRIGINNAVGSLTINSGQTYTSTTEVALGRTSGATSSGSGTLNLNGGNLSTGTLYFNQVSAAPVSPLVASTFNFNGGNLTATQILRHSAGASQTFNWNDGTIANTSGGNLTLTSSVANSAPSLVVSLAGTGTHTFNATSGQSIIVSANATLADKSGEQGTLRKAGAGTLNIQSSSTSFTGGTTVSAGTLLISGTGSINSTSGVSVANGATFTNTSSVAFTKALTLAEGATVSGSGSFMASSLTLTADLSDGFATFALGTTSFTKDGNLEFTLSGITNGTYDIFSGSALTGTFASMSVGGISLTSLGGGDFSGTVGGRDYTFFNATNQLTIVPEPATWALVAAGLTVSMVLRRRRMS